MHVCLVRCVNVGDSTFTARLQATVVVLRQAVLWQNKEAILFFFFFFVVNAMHKCQIAKQVWVVRRFIKRMNCCQTASIQLL